MLRTLTVIPAIGWILLSIGCFAVGEYFSKLWGNGPNVRYTLFMLTSYSMGSLLWLPSLLHKNSITQMGLTWSILSVVMTTLLGVGYFGESLTFWNWSGVFLAFASVILLQL